ncbi:hypothetical protein C8Q73DRAFT_56857 [Cubamyces lactineus]|nr:hypothetical protein C8Q73DRAFT_56857 [Cubamyces lactineus]
MQNYQVTRWRAANDKVGEHPLALTRSLEAHTNLKTFRVFPDVGPFPTNHELNHFKPRSHARQGGHRPGCVKWRIWVRERVCIGSVHCGLPAGGGDRTGSSGFRTSPSWPGLRTYVNELCLKALGARPVHVHVLLAARESGGPAWMAAWRIGKEYCSSELGAGTGGGAMPSGAQTHFRVRRPSMLLRVVKGIPTSPNFRMASAGLTQHSGILGPPALANQPSHAK